MEMEQLLVLLMRNWQEHKRLVEKIRLVKLMGLNVTSTQGDIKYREFFDMLKKAKATIDISNNI